MHIRRLSFRNIRNHAQTELDAAEGVNVITGMNGQGKTTILEAISLCTLTRSFVGTGDAFLMKRDAKGFDAKIESVSDYAVPHRIELRYEPGAGKSIALDGSPAASASQVIGTAPTVVLSPDLKGITGGAPQERRRFLDMVISQAKRRYLEDLIQYRRILKQRNTLLASARAQKRTIQRELIEPWDEGLVERAAHLMYDRAQFVREFEPIFKGTALEVATGADTVEIAYAPDAVKEPLCSLNEYRDALWLRSQEVWREEQRRGTTLFGAHRDDVRMTINGGDVRVSASQGQHKTLLIGLKIAEFHYLAGQCAETPIILLDDIFGELDARRAERVYDLTRELAQVFITVVSVDMLPFLRGRRLSSGEARFRVDGGAIVGREGTGGTAGRRDGGREEDGGTGGTAGLRESSLAGEPEPIAQEVFEESRTYDTQQPDDPTTQRPPT